MVLNISMSGGKAQAVGRIKAGLTTSTFRNLQGPVHITCELKLYR